MAENINYRRIGTTQTLAATGTSAIGSAFGAQSYLIRVVGNTPLHIKVQDSAVATVATTADPYLPANWPDFFTITPGQKIATIRASTDGIVTSTSGTLWVTEFGS
jgi:hypothetical protein